MIELEGRGGNRDSRILILDVGQVSEFVVACPEPEPINGDGRSFRIRNASVSLC